MSLENAAVVLRVRQALGGVANYDLSTGDCSVAYDHIDFCEDRQGVVVGEVLLELGEVELHDVLLLLAGVSDNQKKRAEPSCSSFEG